MHNSAVSTTLADSPKGSAPVAVSYRSSPCRSRLASPKQTDTQLLRRRRLARLVVDGSPYLMLGGQVHNSDTANADDLNKALDVLVGWHANTAEVPIYWEAIEPNPGAVRL